MRRTSSDGRTSSAFANITTVRIVGLRSPRSTMLMYVRSSLATNPKRSWETSRFLRNSRSATPKACSGPSIDWEIGRAHV